LDRYRLGAGFSPTESGRRGGERNFQRGSSGRCPIKYALNTHMWCAIIVNKQTSLALTHSLAVQPENLKISRKKKKLLKNFHRNFNSSSVSFFSFFWLLADEHSASGFLSAAKLPEITDRSRSSSRIRNVLLARRSVLKRLSKKFFLLCIQNK